MTKAVKQPEKVDYPWLKGIKGGIKAPPIAQVPPKDVPSGEPMVKVKKPSTRKGVARPQTDASKPPKPAKKPHGRPKFEPTDAERNKVMSALAIGGDQRSIAKLLGIAQKTLIKHFRKELDEGYEMAKLDMGTVAYEAAKQARYDPKFIGALTHYENTRFGYKTNQGLDHTSSDGSMESKATVLLLPE